ncbi:tetratricopeptide repeat protein [Niveibacterium sp. 24ML]|uniref:tetratricopeptide repeat protein n=1 Tax=Niveibacterium sp. 24ML TaxID=2985512 RepID=UPI00226FF7BE|nr:DUF6445 family protein [Niveibacterium sp. 24ML]MCX9154752.1 tetratricopeptide repeat protein [Niveibacterium sp. 24ML]
MNARKPDPMIHLARGMELHRHGRIPEAVRAYQSALQIAPGLHAATKYQGLALFQMGLREPGLAMMRRAAEQLPEDASAHFNLGQALCSVGRESDGLAAFMRAAQLEPGDADAAAMAASLAERLGERGKAIELWQSVVSARPAFAEGWDELSRLCYLDNQLEAALDAHRRALALDPSVIERRRIGFADPDPAQARPIVSLPLDAARHPSMASREALDQFAADTGLAIIDEVVRHPLGYREHALEREFQPVAYAGQNFPGLQTRGSDPQEIMTIVATALGRRVKWISPDNGVCRLSYADSTARTDIHVDNEEGDNRDRFAAVLYLNLPGQEQGGTTFWRQLDTGWTRRLPDEDLKRNGFTSFKAFQEKWLPNQNARRFSELTADRKAWEPIVELAMKNNRLVLYRGDFFHSLSSVFGSTPQDGRLVQLFFFEPA